MVGAKGFEPSTSWSRTRRRTTILLARLALLCVKAAGLGWSSAVNGLNWDSIFGMNPYSETNSLGTLAVSLSLSCIS